MNDMTDRIQEIPPLLHDARLTDWHWVSNTPCPTTMNRPGMKKRS
jgi:hypothetical protein